MQKAAGAVLSAMAYQVEREIGAMAAALYRRVSHHPYRRRGVWQGWQKRFPGGWSL